MKSRTYPVPKTVTGTDEGPLLASILAAGCADSRQLERAAWTQGSTALGLWARRILRQESISVLDRVLESDELPVGILAAGTDDMVVALRCGGRVMSDRDGWEDLPYDGTDELVDLDEDTVAFVATALLDGADGVILRSWFPLADLTAAAPAPVPGAATDVPAGGVVVAVVDDLDRTAVLDLLAVAPGPIVYRRHDGSWQVDDNYLRQLRGITPPPLVELDPAMVASVESQVDESTKGMPFDATQPDPVAASAWTEAHQQVADDMKARFVLLAASKGATKIKNKIGGHVGGEEKLKEYWTTGEGGLVKIRWGTPGAWGRCHKHLLKYLGPRAAGFCTNLGQRLGGRGVAWDVGGAAKRAAKRAVK